MTAKVLSIALDGASHSRIVTLVYARHEEIEWLLKVLVDKGLLEYSSSLYWTTIEGVKFLEIHLHMERILQAKKSLV